LKTIRLQITLFNEVRNRAAMSGALQEERCVSEKGDIPNETIFSESVVGQRLSKVHKPGPMFLVFQGRNIPITSRITVGRDADNSIVLDDSLASRHHAVIQKLKNQYFIEDLDSTNCTLVNSKRVPLGKYVRLHPDDTILIGRTVLSLRHLR
jgi:hypothetical protein